MWKWIYKRLDEQFPDFAVERWWGVADRFARMIGAVLVQNTTWNNAAKALARLEEVGWLEPEALAARRPEEVMPVIRSAGFPQAKSGTIISLANWLKQHGGFAGLLARQKTTEQLRSELLFIRGVGEETADTILAYCLGLATISADAYTRRLYARMSGEELRYRPLRRMIMEELREPEHLARLHGLIVEHGKAICRKRQPVCHACTLRSRCLYAGQQQP
ncbi:endonuclease III domain-containing protein [Brevibacillus marinus]|uniref:endonuclease III domain-containing protein n=1 Tax=Brevibacillus marinus TaxID=2496837 RepID=UPI000F849637|nr:endonuclease [Brevibacillus marinus]